MRRVHLCFLWWWLALIAALLDIWPACSDQHASQRGHELFQQNCAMCHEASNLDLKKQPPKLEGLFQRKALPSGAPATDAQVRKTIINGIGTMPSFQGRLSDEDVNNLVEYLHQLN